MKDFAGRRKLIPWVRHFNFFNVTLSFRAGDMRRALAASERLCMLVGDSDPQQRRDAAVLLYHVGNIDQAAVELDVYMSSQEFRDCSADEHRSVERLMALIQSSPGAFSPGHSFSCWVLTYSAVLISCNHRKAFAHTDACYAETVRPWRSKAGICLVNHLWTYTLSLVPCRV